MYHMEPSTNAKYARAGPLRSILVALGNKYHDFTVTRRVLFLPTSYPNLRGINVNCKQTHVVVQNVSQYSRLWIKLQIWLDDRAIVVRLPAGVGYVTLLRSLEDLRWVPSQLFSGYRNLFAGVILTTRASLVLGLWMSRAVTPLHVPWCRTQGQIYI